MAPRQDLRLGLPMLREPMALAEIHLHSACFSTAMQAAAVRVVGRQLTLLALVVLEVAALHPALIQLLRLEGRAGPQCLVDPQTLHTQTTLVLAVVLRQRAQAQVVFSAAAAAAAAVIQVPQRRAEAVIPVPLVAVAAAE